MKSILVTVFLVFSSCIYSGKNKGDKDSTQLVSTDSLHAKTGEQDSAVLPADTGKTDSIRMPATEIRTGNVYPQQVIAFAKTLIGTPYHYASTDPKVGFDCSGFITYVFSHFNIIVPRSSIDFTNVGRTIPADSAKAGDLILFTGTDSTEKFVGHMGLVISNQNNTVQFIHSTSGRKHGVTITPLNTYYQNRYVKTIRIFPETNSRQK